MLNRPSSGIGLVVVTWCVVALVLLSGGSARAACPPGQSNPITSGGGVLRPPIILGSLGPAPRAFFYLLGSGNINNSGSLPASAWLHNVGDLDGEGRPDFRIDAPGDGPGGWGDPRTNGCPSTLDTPHPPLVIVITHEREDRDGDGKFDIFEDINHNGVLDPGEDQDGDGRLTPPGGCEGALREDVDCDGHPDLIWEDQQQPPARSGRGPGRRREARLHRRGREPQRRARRTGRSGTRGCSTVRRGGCCPRRDRRRRASRRRWPSTDSTGSRS